ncbi:hypothetical protein J7K28_08000, partial [Candidatus Aerophobetes bacterium]|nr:hypothetical protein [Candidatus Aerophobetes bacterium]
MLLDGKRRKAFFSLSIIFVFFFSFLILISPFSIQAQGENKSLRASAISIADSPDPVSPGGYITYTIDANIEGALGGYVISYLDRNVEYVSSDPEGYYDSAYHSVRWDLPTSAPLQWEATLKVKVLDTTPVGTSISNDSELDDIYGNVLARDTETTTVSRPLPSLTLTKQDTPDPVLAGSSITYTLSYSNSGNATAT